jgi:hypothetical protein
MYICLTLGGQVSSWLHTVEFAHCVLHHAPKDCMKYSRTPTDGLPAALHYEVSYCKGLPLGAVALVCGVVVDIFALRKFQGLFWDRS